MTVLVETVLPYWIGAGLGVILGWVLAWLQMEFDQEVNHVEDKAAE